MAGREVVDRIEPTPRQAPLTGGGSAADPSSDAHLRRALALVELSRLVIDPH